MKKKFLSLVLAAVMCLGAFNFVAFAEGEDGVKDEAELREYFATFNAFLANTGDGPDDGSGKATDRLNMWNADSQARILRAASYVRWVLNGNASERNSTNAYYIFEQAMFREQDATKIVCKVTSMLSEQIITPTTSSKAVLLAT